MEEREIGERSEKCDEEERGGEGQGPRKAGRESRESYVKSMFLGHLFPSHEVARPFKLNEMKQLPRIVVSSGAALEEEGSTPPPLSLRISFSQPRESKKKK